ncbi:helix-turn-helix domain-containing protein [Promicromonospora sp. MEB111]|uniref:ArsR/SmtB family transcription factor n=1 Tax=Promicromonospora sp. MEB111 TaxID=3040301 RepID=UPI00254B2D4B|nr:helix-turn-helix domain-containing protein [Promicromonospora sp. MEB111]
MVTSAASPVAAFAALGDETRWAVLQALSGGEHSGEHPEQHLEQHLEQRAAEGAFDPASGLTASALAARLPVTRQAIAKHLAVLEAAGLVESWVVGRERRYRALGAELTALGRRLERIGDAWEARLGRIAGIAERLERG